MANESQCNRSRGQGAPVAQKINLQMPMDLEQTVKDMMQQMESFKRDPRLQDLFVWEETSGTT